MTTNSNKQSLITKKDFWKSFMRSCTLDAAWNYERMQNLAFAYMMIPIIKRVYSTKEDIKNALHRHLEFFSTTPHISTLLVGILGAMEEKNSQEENFDSNSINAVKASLMGPMAAIGDSLIWGTLRIIATGIAISFSSNGNIFGPILFILAINVPAFFLRYQSLKQGFNFGSQFVQKIGQSGLMEKVTKGASILGLTVIGGMVASMIYFEIPFTVGSGEFAKPVQEYLNEIMPSLLPLSIFGIMYYLLGKNIKTTTLLLWIIIISIAGVYVGLF